MKKKEERRAAVERRKSGWRQLAKGLVHMLNPRAYFYNSYFVIGPWAQNVGLTCRVLQKGVLLDNNGDGVLFIR